MIEICNLRKNKPVYPYDVRVDRRTVLGNPFPMRTERNRDEACDKYADWFNEQRRANPKFIAELNGLLQAYRKYGTLRLFCWCAPKRCHAETIRKWLEWQIKK